MRSLNLELEVTTPLFLSGADQSTAELRTPSFKGLLRWWYRAAKRGITPEEFDFFGSTESSARWRLRIKPISISTETFLKDNFYNYNGIKYLGFSLDSRVEGEIRQRVFIQDRSRFHLQLMMSASITLIQERALLSSLWFLLWLGNVGTRSRRGFGSLRVNRIIEGSQNDLEFTFQGNLDSFKKFLDTNLKKALEWVQPVESDSPLPQYTIFSPANTKLYLWKKPFDNWERALNSAGEFLMNFRKRKPEEDYQQVKQFLLNSTPVEALQRPAFGLPIQFYFTSVEREKLKTLLQRELNKKGVPDSQRISQEIAEKKTRDRKPALENLKHNGARVFEDKEVRWLFKRARTEATANVSGEGSDGGGHERRASPLFIKVVKLGEKQYALLFLFMKARLLGQIHEADSLRNEQVTVTKEKANPINVDPPAFDLVEKFLEDQIAPNSWEIAL